MLSIIEELIKFSPRQLDGEKKAREFIQKYLKNKQIVYSSQKFKVYLPKYKKYYLKVDKEPIDCLPCGLKSGKIESKKYLTDATLDSASKDKKAISFSSKCNSISIYNFYFDAALAISQKDIPKISEGRNIQGCLKVNKIIHETANILVGNKINPQNIIFTHYDCFGPGAVDNASGVAVVLKLLEKANLGKNLFVLSGCEELSFDKPIYWGYGFRVFEKKYFKILENSEKIIVIDSVGNGKNAIFDKKDHEILRLGFPLRNINCLKDKVFCISGDFERLMRVYHSELDDMSQINPRCLNEAFQIAEKMIIS